MLCYGGDVCEGNEFLCRNHVRSNRFLSVWSIYSDVKYQSSSQEWNSAHLSLPSSHTCFCQGSHFLCSPFFFFIFILNFLLQSFIKKKKKLKLMRISKHLYFEFIWCFLSLIKGVDTTDLPNFRVSEGTKTGSAALDIEILHRSEFRALCCFTSWAQFHSFVWLYFLGIILSLCSPSVPACQIVPVPPFCAFTYCSKTEGMYFSTEKSFNLWLMFLWP